MTLENVALLNNKKTNKQTKNNNNKNLTKGFTGELSTANTQGANQFLDKNVVYHFFQDYFAVLMK